jgi:hypothetical protein
LDHAPFDPSPEQLGHDHLLVAATGFADYPHRAPEPEFLDEPSTRFGRVGEKPFVGLAQTVIELVLGDIQTNVVGGGVCRHG